MRITTQMLAESANRAGLPINNTSLLDYIDGSSTGNTLLDALNKSSSTGNTLLDALNKSGSAGSTLLDALNKSNSATGADAYADLQKAADRLWKAAEPFTEDGEESVFAKARRSGDKEEIYTGVESLVKGYNDAAKGLLKNSTPLNDFYRQAMLETTAENKEALASIGITISKDGTATLDGDKLREADVDTLESVLRASGISEKMAFLGSRISDNAQANTANLSSRYSATGNVYSALNSKYDFWG